MAEIVGTIASALTLAALFKSCVDAFDMFRTAQNQAIDLKKLTLRLNIEKCRLYTWGQGLGLTSTESSQQTQPLDQHQYAELVYEALELIIKTLSDSSRLKDKYGCRGIDAKDANILSIEAPTNVFQKLSGSFDNFKIKSQGQAQQAVRKTYWVIHDRQKFEGLITEAKGLIDGLQDITKALQSSAAQQGLMSSRIRRIDDVRTLDWISEVCEVEYPLLSDAASSEAESLSENRTLARDIQTWKDSIDSDSDTSSEETTIAALEDMTVTEIKHKFSTYLARAKEARIQKAATGGAGDHIIGSEAAIKSQSNVNPTPSDGLDETGRAEFEANQRILANMAEASLDPEYQDETNAILSWFRVLSPGERTHAFYKLGEELQSDADMTRFFARIQNYRAAKLPSTSTKLLDQPEKFAGLLENHTSKRAETHVTSDVAVSHKRHGADVWKPPAEEVLGDLERWDSSWTGVSSGKGPSAGASSARGPDRCKDHEPAP